MLPDLSLGIPVSPSFCPHLLGRVLGSVHKENYEFLATNIFWLDFCRCLIHPAPLVTLEKGSWINMSAYRRGDFNREIIVTEFLGGGSGWEKLINKNSQQLIYNLWKCDEMSLQSPGPWSSPQQYQDCNYYVVYFRDSFTTA